MSLRILLTILILSIPTIALGAGLIPCGGPGDDPRGCIACDFTKLGSNIINFLITIGAGIAVVLIAVAGLRMVMARGNMGEIEKAKAIFTNLVVGFIILLGAWLIVDTVLKTFVGESRLGTWNEIQCVYPEGYTDDLDPPTVVILPPSPPGGTPPPPPPPGGTPPPPPPSGEGGTFQIAGINSAQQGHKSSTLSSFQSCIAGKVEAGTYYITSISDDKIANGTYTFAYCSANGQGGGCAHSAGSCHYGGRGSCVGKSYALDIRTSNLTATQKSSVLAAASSCGGWGQSEGDHLHVSKGSACGCN